MDPDDERLVTKEDKIEDVRPKSFRCEMHDKSGGEDGPPELKMKEVGVERKLLKNGGLTKTVVKHGTCKHPKSPLSGDEVTVHYTGTLPDGTVFDSTRDKEPFTFKLGVGQVIRGWDKGVKTMRKGEQAVFTVQPQYAYGKAGQPPGIPPDTPLRFDIELLSWCSVKDVCRDGGVMKKIVREGKSWETPKDSDEVKVNYEVKLEDGTLISKSPDDGVKFIVEEGWLCPAFKHAVKSMKIEEVVVLMVQPEYGFGIDGREAKDSEGPVPLNATLIVDLELVSWNSVEIVTDDKKVIKKITKKGESYEKPNGGSTVTIKYVGTLSDGAIFEKRGLHPEDPVTVTIDDDQVVPGLEETLATMKKGEAKDSWDLDGPQKIAAAAKKKDQGNDLFKKGKLFFAARKYEKGGRHVEYESIFADGDEKNDARSLKMTLKLNEAACRLKLNSFPEVVDLTSKVLEIDSMNLKALFRRAQAYSAMMDLELAEQDLKKVLESDPNNRDAKLEQKKLNKKQVAHRKTEAKLYGNMFARLIKMEEKESKQADKGLANLPQVPALINPAEVSVQGYNQRVTVCPSHAGC
ncbi:hypothetical protein KC19_VG283100 [Ceratodon purpureus]|uniref:peptidylprolyl isomerase n=1 Tax=Ceratodon purpureus TaxID=3225 RepID=A0A8T0HUN5_CERPU|nr:hypothetical protein KC19_VG283100 [Ceratodon purpureus]